MVRKRYSQYIKDMAERIVLSVRDESFFSKVQDDKTHVDMHVIKDEAQVLDRILADDGSRNRKGRSTKDDRPVRSEFINKDKVISDDGSNNKNKTYKEDVERKERKSINSGFTSLDDAYFNIEECVISASEDIAAWVDGAKNGEKESFSIELPADQDYDPVGTGYVVSRDTNGIAEYQTQSVRIVLKKDDTASLGFTLLTAYPDIIAEECRVPTGRDLRDIVKRTKTYADASPVAQDYMLCQTSPEQRYLITFKPGYYGNTHDDVMSVHIPYKTKQGDSCKHIIRVKEDSIEFSTSVLTDVHMAKNFKGSGKDKIIYPGEDLANYQKYTLTTEKKFVKTDSYFTRHFNPKNEQGFQSRSVDLRRDDVFDAFKKRFPEAAALISDARDGVIARTGFKQADVAQTHKHEEVTLNDNLSPKEVDPSKKNDGIDSPDGP